MYPSEFLQGNPVGYLKTGFYAKGKIFNRLS